MPYTPPVYDAENIFAKIIKGEMPSHKIYEDDHSFAFMDIMPRCDGHSLVIPKQGARNILDVQPDSLAKVMESVQLVARASLKAFDADGITMQQFNESAGGQVVFHLHFHILPRMEGVKLRPHTGDMADNDILAAQADKLRGAIENELAQN